MVWTIGGASSGSGRIIVTPRVPPPGLFRCLVVADRAGRKVLSPTCGSHSRALGRDERTCGDHQRSEAGVHLALKHGDGTI
jgi:hypothetical protein